jgi:hypothetical protein
MEAKTKADQEREKHIKKDMQHNYMDQLDQVRNVREHEKKIVNLERKIHDE